jgi:hypothetical protein
METCPRFEFLTRDRILKFEGMFGTQEFHRFYRNLFIFTEKNEGTWKKFQGAWILCALVLVVNLSTLQSNLKAPTCTLECWTPRVPFRTGASCWLLWTLKPVESRTATRGLLVGGSTSNTQWLISLVKPWWWTHRNQSAEPTLTRPKR